MKYEEMCDFEINRKLAELLHSPSEPYCIIHNEVWHKSIGHIIGSIPNGAFKFLNDDRWWVPFPDYCNNPSDAWPIIVDNEINLDPRRTIKKLPWMASASDQIYATDKNPLRAAMICFLKIKDSEGGNN